jgi:hypothetical protein
MRCAPARREAYHEGQGLDVKQPLIPTIDLPKMGRVIKNQWSALHGFLEWYSLPFLIDVGAQPPPAACFSQARAPVLHQSKIETGHR